MGFESGKITSIRIEGVPFEVSNVTCQTQSGRIADKVSMKVSGTLAYNGPAPTPTFALDPRIAEIASLKAENEKLQEQVRINAEGWGKALQWRKDHERSGRVSMGRLRMAVMNAIRNPGTMSANIFLAIAEAAESKEATDRLRRDIRIGVVTPEEVHDMKKASLILHVDPLGNARDVAPSPFGPSPLADIPKIMDAHDARTDAICQQFALPAELCGYSPLMTLPSNPEAVADARVEKCVDEASDKVKAEAGDCFTPIINKLAKIKAGKADGRFSLSEVAKMASLKYPSVDPEGKTIPWTAIGCRVKFDDQNQGVVVEASPRGPFGEGWVSIDRMPANKMKLRCPMRDVTFLDMPQETPTPAQPLQLRNGMAVEFYTGYSRDMPYKAKYGPSADRTEREMEQEAAALKSGAMTVNEVREKRGLEPYPARRREEFSDEAAIVMVAPLTDEQKERLREAIAKQCTGLKPVLLTPGMTVKPIATTEMNAAVAKALNSPMFDPTAIIEIEYPSLADAPATVGATLETCNRCKLPSKIVVCFPIEGELCEACKDVVTAESAPKEDESEADRAAMMAFMGKTAGEWK